MESDNSGKFDSVYSNKVRAGKRRTYFFDVRQTKGEDYYVTLTESTRKFEGEGYQRHKIFLYKEDFNRFMNGLQDAVNHVKENLMPDYDYEQFERKQAEWEAQKAAEAAAAESSEANEIAKPEVKPDENTGDTATEDDISW